MHNDRRMVFTFDLEDHRPNDSYSKRYPEITDRLLGFLAERDIEATVFVLGRVAHESPDLIKQIAAAGHEIGFHSYAHVHLNKQDPAQFQHETIDNKNYLEDLLSRRVLGYRAPAFSLTRESLWAIELIAACGFEYSSSVLPARSPICGFPGAPMQPFRWSNGLLEIPAPVARLCGTDIPFLGGIYLRYLPGAFIRHSLARGEARQCYWAYCHPHDFDHRERFYRIKGTSLATSILLWLRRKKTFEKLGAIFPRERGSGELKSFASLIAAGAFSNAPVFEV